jgi:hypothetical protein
MKYLLNIVFASLSALAAQHGLNLTISEDSGWILTALTGVSGAIGLWISHKVAPWIIKRWDVLIGKFTGA